MKKHNFYAGPSIMSQYTIKNTADAVLDFANTGLSILEVSHRSKEFQAVMDEAQALVKELLEVPEGASLQFAMVPYNLLKKKAAYLDTGVWAHKAVKEAKLFGDVDVVASSEDKNYNYIPKGYTVPADVDYFHYTTNNTIYGTEIRKNPDLIYAGAQKNLAPAGATIVIVRDDAVQTPCRPVPTMLNYKTHIDKGSMFNTPPVLPIFSALQTLRYYKELGGIKAIEKMDLDKAALLYEAIDSSKIFEATVPDHADRSIMNVCFVLKPEYADQEKAFMEFATSKGIVGIKGHRSVGGFRASLYNALPIESVKVLVEAMKEFQNKL